MTDPVLALFREQFIAWILLATTAVLAFWVWRIDRDTQRAIQPAPTPCEDCKEIVDGWDNDCECVVCDGRGAIVAQGKLYQGVFDKGIEVGSYYSMLINCDNCNGTGYIPCSE